MDDPQPVMQPRNEAEAEEVCAELRAAGIRCGWMWMPDPLDALAYYRRAPDVLRVFVDNRDLETARRVLAGPLAP